MTAVNIFSAGAGKVIALDDDTAVPFTFTVDGSTRTFNDLKAIVTSVGIQATGGYQFMHSLREFIYVYVFTERVGELVISGLAFPGSCAPLSDGDDVSTGCVKGSTGVQRVLKWYECNRITVRAEPIIITFGALVGYDAFLTSAKVDIANAETGIAQFVFRFNYLPNTVDNDDFCFDSDESCMDLPCGSQD